MPATTQRWVAELLRSVARQIRNAVTARGLFVPPGHYYSPISSVDDRRRQSDWNKRASLPGVDLNAEAQLDLALRLSQVASGFTPRRWTDGPTNTMFDIADAKVLFAMLTLLRPARIVEVGSGYSTAVMLDASDEIGTTRDITAVEPYPQRLLSLLVPDDDPVIIESPVQQVPFGVFEKLGSGDLLFIDSTHVAKNGSDVHHLFFEVLPRLAAGVIVHVHDIFWPFSYCDEWLDEGRDWSEAHLLRAFLVHNERWEIVLFNDWLWRMHPDLAARIVAGDHVPGSIYLRAR